MSGLLTGKVAIVTGAAGDIGRVIARRCAEEGAAVLATDFDEAALKRATDALVAENFTVVGCKHDVTSEEHWRQTVEAAVANFQHLDILINSAGMTPVSLIEDMTLQEWNRVINVNTTGPFLGMRTALPELRKAAAASEHGASIVNIASAQGLVAGQPGLSAYTASKAALRLLTRTAAVEFGRLGYKVRCNAVVPSAIGGTTLMNHMISTQVERGIFENLEQGMKVINSAFPLGRTATALDVAEAVMFLASDRAKSITGIDLVVDSGRCA